jgi:hypothetical protein
MKPVFVFFVQVCNNCFSALSHCSSKLRSFSFFIVLVHVRGHQCCESGSVQIRIIFQDLDPFLDVLGSGSGSVSYFNEYNKIYWKENSTKHAFWLGPGGPTDKENQVNMSRKYCFRNISSLNGKDPDPYQTVKSGTGPVWNRKTRCGSISKGSGSATLVYASILWNIKALLYLYQKGMH